MGLVNQDFCIYAVCLSLSFSFVLLFLCVCDFWIVLICFLAVPFVLLFFGYVSSLLIF